MGPFKILNPQTNKNFQKIEYLKPFLIFAGFKMQKGKKLCPLYIKQILFIYSHMPLFNNWPNLHGRTNRWKPRNNLTCFARWISNAFLQHDILKTDFVNRAWPKTILSADYEIYDGTGLCKTGLKHAITSSCLKQPV